MKRRLPLTAVVAIIAISGFGSSQSDWKDATVTNIRTVNEWCRHCPDWNKTRYSFRLDDGMTYVGETHKRLNVTLSGRTRVRLEGNGGVGDNLHIVDDSNKDQKLRIVQKIAP